MLPVDRDPAPTESRKAFPWLECLLGAAILSLTAQLLGANAGEWLAALDFRKWSRTTWFLANLVFVASLVGVRYGPAVLSSLQLSKERSRLSRGNQQARENSRRRRLEIERAKEARSRRIW